MFQTWPVHYTAWLDIDIVSICGWEPTPSLYYCGRCSFGHPLSNSTCWHAFATRAQMQLHIKRFHTFKPQGCLLCNDGTIYHSNKEVQRHQRQVHRAISEQSCPLADSVECSSPTKLFTPGENLRGRRTISTLYRDHLCRIHLKGSDELKRRVGADGFKGKISHSCPIDAYASDCHSNGALRQHSKSRHAFTEEEAYQRVPLSYKEKKLRKYEE